MGGGGLIFFIECFTTTFLCVHPLVHPLGGGGGGGDSLQFEMVGELHVLWNIYYTLKYLMPTSLYM